MKSTFKSNDISRESSPGKQNFLDKIKYLGN